MFLAAVADRPSLGDVIGNGGGSGPDVAVTGNVATIIEIIEDAELTSELVLIGRDVFAVHRQGWIAIADAEITEDLVVSAIFFNDVDDVMDLVLPGGEGDAVGIAAHGVGFGDLLREGWTGLQANPQGGCARASR